MKPQRKAIFQLEAWELELIVKLTNFSLHFSQQNFPEEQRNEWKLGTLKSINCNYIYQQPKPAPKDGSEIQLSFLEVKTYLHFAEF